MWATVHAFAHSDLAGMTLIPAPKCGHTLLDHGRDRELLTEVTENCRFPVPLRLPTGLNQRCQVPNYRAGLAERVTTV